MAPPNTRKNIRNRILCRFRRCRNHPHQIVGRRRLVVVGLVLGLASAMGSVPVVVIVAIVAEAVEGVLEVSSIRRCCVVRRVAIVYQYYELLAISILLEIEPNKSLSSVFQHCAVVLWLVSQTIWRDMLSTGDPTLSSCMSVRCPLQTVTCNIVFYTTTSYSLSLFSLSFFLLSLPLLYTISFSFI